MKKFATILAICVCVVSGLFFTNSEVASAPNTVDSSGHTLFLDVYYCNNNNICDSGAGENIINCPIDCPVINPTTTPPGGGGGGGGGWISLLPPVLNLLIVPTTNSATITWQTPLPFLSKFYWGETPDNELGTLSEVTYSIDHKVILNGLKPNTLYYFSITAITQNGIIVRRFNYFFRTLPIQVSVGPDNVTNLKAVASGSTITLTWTNPTNPDFSNVRIVRLSDYYPRGPFSAPVVYEASNNIFPDRNLAVGPYYYAVFARNTKGQYSTGVLTQARIKSSIKTTEPLVGDTSTSTDTYTPTIPPQTPDNLLPDYLKKITAQNFFVIQNGKKNILKEINILNAVDPVTVLLEAHNLPKNLRTISLHIQDPSVSTFYNSYLLTYDNEHDRYQALLNPFIKPGVYPFVISIADLDLHAFRTITGEFTIISQPTTFDQGQNYWLLIYCSIYLSLVLITFFLHFRRKS